MVGGDGLQTTEIVVLIALDSITAEDGAGAVLVIVAVLGGDINLGVRNISLASRSLWLFLYGHRTAPVYYFIKLSMLRYHALQFLYSFFDS